MLSIQISTFPVTVIFSKRIKGLIDSIRFVSIVEGVFFVSLGICLECAIYYNFVFSFRFVIDLTFLTFSFYLFGGN